MESSRGPSVSATEIVAAILLGLGGVATAWCSYQAARWSGVQAANYSRAGGFRTQHSLLSTRAGQMQTIDLGLFFNWLNATADHQPVLAEFYRQRFRTEFKGPFEEWLALKPLTNPSAPNSPFAMPSYHSELFGAAAALDREATKYFAAAQAANEIADNYVLNAVVLALVLFFAGISQPFRAERLRGGLVAMATLMLAYGLYNVLRYPVQ